MRIQRRTDTSVACITKKGERLQEKEAIGETTVQATCKAGRTSFATDDESTGATAEETLVAAARVGLKDN